MLWNQTSNQHHLVGAGHTAGGHVLLWLPAHIMYRHVHAITTHSTSKTWTLMDKTLAGTQSQQDAARWLKAGVVPSRTCLCTHSPAAGPQLSSSRRRVSARTARACSRTKNRKSGRNIEYSHHHIRDRNECFWTACKDWPQEGANLLSKSVGLLGALRLRLPQVLLFVCRLLDLHSTHTQYLLLWLQEGLLCSSNEGARLAPGGMLPGCACPPAAPPCARGVRAPAHLPGHAVK